MLDLLSNVGNFLLFVVALGAIIFVHELGHFMTAKWVGINVRRFAVGLGKPAISWRKGLGIRFGSSVDEAEKAEKQGRTDLGETEYCLCWVPLGGYVAMVGQEDVGADEASDDPRAFNNKPIWQRMIVISAGVIMNIIFAVLFFIIAFMIGVKFPPAEVGMVQHDAPAAKAEPVNADIPPGLLPGDQTLSINGEPISDFTEKKVNIALASDDSPLDIVVRRPAWRDEPAREIRFKVGSQPGPQGLPSIGVTQPFSRRLPAAKQLPDDQAAMLRAELAEWPGLELGMELTAVNGEPIDAHWQYLRWVLASGGEPLDLTFRQPDGDQTARVTVKPRSELQTDAAGPDGEGDAAAQAMAPRAHLMGLVPPVKISEVVPDSAADGKLKPGDLLAGIGDYPWPSTPQVSRAVAAAKDKPLTITVLRDGQVQRISVTPQKQSAFGRALLGIRFGQTQDTTIAASWVAGHPLAALDAPPGTRITSVNDQPVNDLNELRRALETAGPGEVEIAYTVPLLGGSDRTARVDVGEASLAALTALPWRDPIMSFQTRRELQKAGGPGEALAIGVGKTWTFLKQVYMTLLGLIEQTISPKHLSGPVGITAIGTQMADQGLSYLFWFAGLISVNLAVVNFLPLPIVDGGLFVMLIIEKLRGKPLPVAVQSAISLVGIVLLAAVFLFVTYNDIVRLIG